MNHIPNTCRPTDTDGMVAVRIAVPAGRDEMLPENNFIGSIILHRHLERELAHAGILLCGGGFGKPLNQCELIFEVSSIIKAVELIRAEFEAVGMRQSVTIIFGYPQEDIWRNADTFDLVIFSVKQIKRDIEENTARLRVMAFELGIKEFLKLLRGQTPPPK